MGCGVDPGSKATYHAKVESQSCQSGNEVMAVLYALSACPSGSHNCNDLFLVRESGSPLVKQQGGIIALFQPVGVGFVGNPDGTNPFSEDKIHFAPGTFPELAAAGSLCQLGWKLRAACQQRSV